ncbi:MAG: ATP-dependent DNA helicase RecG [Patescibacteria group bacterium]
MSESFFETPLYTLRHIGIKYAERLTRLGLTTVRDLLRHFPARYEDFSRHSSIAELSVGEQATVQGVIETIDVRKSFRRRMIVVEAFLRDDTGLIKIIWFNQPYLKNTFQPGRLVNISGKVSEEGGDLYFSHPAYEVLDRKVISGSTETQHTGRLIPIYPETHGLTSRTIRFLIQPLLLNAPKMDEWIPRPILRSHNLPEINQAIQHIHFPTNHEEAWQARRRFSFENLFLLQLLNAERRNELAHQNSPKITIAIPWLKDILKELPFTLTLSQKKSLWEIIQDLEKGRPMNRLLQGDVGSGKTVVAALASLAVAHNGYQAVLLAPTEVLATQHFATFKKLFASIDAEHQSTLGLVTAHQSTIFYGTDLEKELTKEKMKDQLKSGKIGMVIGTHALLEKQVAFKNIGLVIIDEQHRFGVRQRAALVKNADLLPHFLSMSATPIPRTLTLTMFGDLDLSIINELPKGRKMIQTSVIPPEKRNQAYALVRREIASGRQVFVVCPRIDVAETNQFSGSPWDRQKLDVKSVKEEYEKLSTTVFPDLKIGMLHGQMKSKEKETAMAQFKKGKIDILVSTSVIEVGVDVSNATVMMIESAERFGLAQLYQFRGRGGRGESQSYCLLFTESNSKTVENRLEALRKAKNGFELAEVDLKLRGPGQLLGNEQTGFPDSLMRSLDDMELIAASRTAATKILEKNNLSLYPALKNRLQEFKAQLHLE